VIIGEGMMEKKTIATYVDEAEANIVLNKLRQHGINAEV